MEKYKALYSKTFRNLCVVTSFLDHSSSSGPTCTGCPLCPLPDTRIGYLSEATTLQHFAVLGIHLVIQNCKESLVNKAPAIC
jgi:hypothetical protein